jgi:hypothetical protein
VRGVTGLSRKPAEVSRPMCEILVRGTRRGSNATGAGHGSRFVAVPPHPWVEVRQVRPVPCATRYATSRPCDTRRRRLGNALRRPQAAFCVPEVWQTGAKVAEAVTRRAVPGSRRGERICHLGRGVQDYILWPTSVRDGGQGRSSNRQVPSLPQSPACWGHRPSPSSPQPPPPPDTA